MSNRKEVEFKAKFDTSDFDKSVESMQKKLKEIYQPSDMARASNATAQKLQQAGLGGGPIQGPVPYSQSTQAAKSSHEALIRQEAQQQEKLAKFIGQREQKLKELQLQQSKITGDAEKELTIKEKIARVEMNLYSQREGYKQRDAALNKVVDRYQESFVPKTPPVPKPENNKKSDEGQLLGGLLKASTVIAATRFLLKSTLDQAMLPIAAKQAQGSANETLITGQARDMTSPFAQAFLPERQAAMQQARQAWQTERKIDKVTNLLSLTATIAGTAMMASGVGALPGALLFTGGMGMMYGPDKQRALSHGDQRSYESMSAKDLADIYQKSKEGEENANPLKRLAAEYNANNYQKNLGTQRNLGISDEGLYGENGFLRKNMAYNGTAQFTQDQVTQMQQSILGAGGSARMARESGFGLQLQKNLDLTNAPQMLGSLSSTMGNAQATKDAMIKVIAEGFKQGLGASELVDVLRTFSQSASEFIQKSGARTDSDASRISEQLGKGLVDNSQAGVESAKTAHEALQRVSGDASGPYSVMRRAAMMKNPLLGKLFSMGDEGSAIGEKLATTPTDQLTEDSPTVQAAKDLLPGTTADQIISQTTSAATGNLNRSKKFYQYQKIVNDFQQKKGVKVTKENIAKGLVPPDVVKAAHMGQVLGNTAGLSAFNFTKSQDMEASFQQGMQPIEEYGPGTSAADAAAKAGSTSNARSGDQVNANTSSAESVFVDNFTKFKEQVVPAAENIDLLTKKLILLGAAAGAVAQGKDPKAATEAAAKALSGGDQQQASSAPASAGGSAGRYRR